MIWNSTSRFLHPPGREGKKKKANKEFGKEIQRNSGGDWKTSEGWPMQTPRRAQSSLSQVYPLRTELYTPALLAIHTPQHTKKNPFFLLETQIPDQVALMLDKSLMMTMPEKRHRSKLHVRVHWDQTLLSPTLSTLHFLKCSCASKKKPP